MKHLSMRNVGMMAVVAMGTFASPAFAQEEVALDSGNTAWMLVSSLLVLMMIVPGLALFYGGMVARNNVLATLMQTVAILCVVSILWPAIGYSLAFASGNMLIGGFDFIMLKGITPSTLHGTIPETVFIMFQLTFAAITTALLVGSVANRIRFSAVMLIAPLWLLLVYVPIAHWVWGSGGFIGGIDLENKVLPGSGFALDFAGGAVVHINSGVAGLVAAIVLGKGMHHKTELSSPSNLIMSVIGTGLLWVGWFGFNAGSALAAGTSAGMAMLVTNTAAAAGGLAWMLTEWVVRGKPSVVGVLSGVVAGLVGITPAAGFVGFGASLIIGLVSGVVCYLAVTKLKAKIGYDDSLDVFGIHGIGGMVGCILTGVLASESIGGVAGLVEGNMPQLISQFASIIVVAGYSAIMTYIILKVVSVIVEVRVSPSMEATGLDMALHGEKVD